MAICTEASFLVVDYNTSDLINSLVKSIVKFSPGFKYNIVVFDNSDAEKLVIEDSLRSKADIVVVDNTKSDLIDFNKLIRECVRTEWGKSNNFASLKHACTVDYCLRSLGCLHDDVVLCDSDILLLKPIDFIDDSFVAVGEVKKTWDLSNERLLPMLCYLNNKALKENGLKYFDRSRFIGCSPGTKYDTGASIYEDIVKRKLNYRRLKISDYCIHLGHGSQRIYGNRHIDVHVREKSFIEQNKNKIE